MADIDARDAFTVAYMEWLISRAAAQSPNIADDETMARASDRCTAAELALIATPAPSDLFLFQNGNSSTLSSASTTSPANAPSPF